MNLPRSRNRRRGLAELAAAAVLLGGLAAPPPAAAAAGEGSVSVLAHQLRWALDRLQFEQVLDTNPPAGAAELRALQLAGAEKEAQPPKKDELRAAVAAAEPISQQPQIDLTVIELNELGRPVSSGTVLMSPQYPDGKVVPVDRNLHTTDVRWRQWDDAGWYANRGQGTIDIVPGRENASIDFMSPYPASVLKLMVAFGVLRLVDQGQISLDDTYHYEPVAPISSLCGPASSNTIRGYLDAALTWSSNNGACAMVKLLHDRGAIDGLNQTFQDLGLETLQLKNTNPGTGGRWGNPVTMSSLDTAKLLMLVNGGLGTLWTAPDGTHVTAAVISDASRAFFKSKLGEQAMNVTLSTTNWCGAAYPAPGIPQLTPSRWIGADGTVTVPGQGIAYGHDVRPCNDAAEVTYAHKNGWVNNSGADAGIVKALPGKGGRTYIVAMFSNLGYQYVDANRPPTGAENVWFTEKLAKLGKIVDEYEKRRYP